MNNEHQLRGELRRITDAGKSSRTSGSTPIPHLRPLTSLRFLAAFLVLGFHVGGTHWEESPWWLRDFFANGYAAVSFFVLSGFVVAYVYGRDGRSLDGPTARKAFWLARFARIYPSFFLALIIGAPFLVYAVAVSGTISVPELIATLIIVPALLQAWVPELALAWNGPAWSISVEAFFYMLFPYLIGWLKRFRPVTIMFFSVLAVIVSGIFRQSFGSATAIGLSPLARHNFVSYFPILFLPHFVFGIGLSRSFSEAGGSRVGAIRALSILCSVLLVILFSMRSQVPEWLVSDVVLVPFFGAVIYGAACSTGTVASILSTDTFVLLGESSYALYILHVPLWSWWRYAGRQAGVQLGYWIHPGLFVVVMLAISCAVFLWLERPARRWILSFASNETQG
jgi:peptidoglycan/LPS O-acetylase OafA/YrhL